MKPGATSEPPHQTTRQFPRFCTDVRVVITLKGSDDPPPLYGRCGIIAEGGFGAILAGELAVGETVAAELILVGGGRPSLKVCAVVRDRRGFRHGFEFLDITPEQRLSIREFCAFLRPAE
jgi:hypothetical protein